MTLLSVPVSAAVRPADAVRYEEAERIEEMLKSGVLEGGQQNVSEKEAVAA